jgi:hypothetical protein
VLIKPFTDRDVIKEYLEAVSDAFPDKRHIIKINFYHDSLLEK